MQNAVLIISHAHAAHSLYDACLSWLLLPTFTIDEHITLFLAQINTHHKNHRTKYTISANNQDALKLCSLWVRDSVHHASSFTASLYFCISTTLYSATQPKEFLTVLVWIRYKQ